MKNNLFFIIYIAILIAVESCNSIKEADTVFYNGTIYTVDSAFSKAQAFAVKNGKILAVGSNDEILKYKCIKKINLEGSPVFPGFIDAHCHFYHYAIDLRKIWLGGSKSFDEVIDTIIRRKDQLFMGWLYARGWDQNDWHIKKYPEKSKLDQLFPDIPVFLMRIDGHAALVNQKALDLAGITESTKINGGEVVIENGKLTGLLIDNAVDLVKNKIPEPTDLAESEALMDAQKNCFAVGLTTVDDAGLNVNEINLLNSLQKRGSLKMRIYAMAMYDSSNAAYFFKRGKLKTERLHVCSFKIYADGALGSRGATLLQPYSDRINHHGFLLHDIDSLKIAAQEIAAHDFQLNSHCIGDSANRIMLQIYHQALKGKNDHRWRIEHAQVVALEDVKLFKNDHIIPSIQPTHATSDMYWAEERLGAERVKTAYAYKKLFEQNNMVASGSDFPVEDINPLFGFYAAVTRKDQHNFPPGGFQMENALNREEALKAMTIWAAFANFEEQEKGSIEKNKFADFVILDDDIMTCKAEKIYTIKVKNTYVNGEKVN